MKRIVCALAASAITTLCLLPGTAAASGPAPPGKETIELECGGGLGKVLVSVPRPEHSNGAGQIVGHKGHGIPVSFKFTLTDVSTGETLFTESEPRKGNGKAHSHQATTSCTGTVAEAPASVFFEGHELPPGVSPGDTIRASFEAQVIVKR
jgi:hypothetical protein